MYSQTGCRVGFGGDYRGFGGPVRIVRRLSSYTSPMRRLIPAMPLLATMLIVARASGAGSPSDGLTPTVVAESMAVFATAEAERKSAAGNCTIEPNAQCEGADFEGVDLGAEFLGNNRNDGLDLTGANLRSANMKGVDLYLADLTGADLTGADRARHRVLGLEW